ncbi:MAG: FAD-dependent monooxygenase [Candidatus Lightella neohaematopini]|nr:FAD-dependent monooxygenase [Candidatus Lightella neohaematopini]
MSITIIGGGIVSIIFTLLVSKNCRKINQINLINLRKNIFIDRTIIISYFTYKVLNKINIWSNIKPYVYPIYKTKIFDINFSNSISILAEDYNIPVLGYAIKLSIITSVFFKIINNCYNINIYDNVNIYNIKNTDDNVIITLNKGYIINTKLFIIADGTQSEIVKFFGINYSILDYRQTAIMTTINTSIFQSHISFEIITKNGLLVLLPIKKHYFSVIWCINNQLSYTNFSNQELHILLKYELQNKLGKIVIVENLNYYPLKLVLAHTNTSHRLVLLGNASKTIHPVGAQGFNLAIRDLIYLINLINLYDIYDHKCCLNMLNQYRKNRQSDWIKTILVTNTLTYLITNKNKFTEKIKNISFLLGKNIPIINLFFIKYILNLI